MLILQLMYCETKQKKTLSFLLLHYICGFCTHLYIYREVHGLIRASVHVLDELNKISAEH